MPTKERRAKKRAEDLAIYERMIAELQAPDWNPFRNPSASYLRGDGGKITITGGLRMPTNKKGWGYFWWR